MFAVFQMIIKLLTNECHMLCLIKLLTNYLLCMQTKTTLNFT